MMVGKRKKKQQRFHNVLFYKPNQAVYNNKPEAMGHKATVKNASVLVNIL